MITTTQYMWTAGAIVKQHTILPRNELKLYIHVNISSHTNIVHLRNVGSRSHLATETLKLL